MDSCLVPDVGVKIGKSNIIWDMVVVDIEDILITRYKFS